MHLFLVSHLMHSHEPISSPSHSECGLCLSPNMQCCWSSLSSHTSCPILLALSLLMYGFCFNCGFCMTVDSWQKRSGLRSASSLNSQPNRKQLAKAQQRQCTHSQQHNMTKMLVLHKLKSSMMSGKRSHIVISINCNDLQPLWVLAQIT